MSLLLVNIELDSIRDFLKRVSESVDAKYSDIMHRAEAGEFANDDEEMNALFSPMMSEEIAVRATLAELNALVESELHNLAVQPLAEKQAKDKPKRPKLAYDLERIDLHRLIEEYYGISINTLPYSKEVDEIRRIVNAYKHRRGFKDPRKDFEWSKCLDKKSLNLPLVIEKFELDRERALRFIDAAQDFIRALRKATKTDGLQHDHLEDWEDFDNSQDA
jgi:hypothetical protein